jgi:hypothetical protein
MPGPVLHLGASATCVHGGMLNILPGNPRVLMGGIPVATIADQGVVAGCLFTIPPGKPQPCVTTRWIVGAARVLVMGQPVLINPCVALTQSAEQIPGGPPLVLASQARVIAT